MPDAAWYPDPIDPSRARWWDGAVWTEHTRAPGPAPYVPMRRVLDADEPAVARRPGSASLVVRPGGPFTVAIVLFTLLPLVEAFGPTLDPNADQLISRVVVAIVVIAASVGLAFWDRRALDAHGYTRSSLVQPAFAIIPVLYLVMRVFRLGALSVLFVLIWGGIQAGAYAFEASDALGLAGGLPVGVAPSNDTGHTLDAPYSPGDRAYLLTVAGMEAKVAHDVKTTSPVTCVPLSSESVGVTTTCDVDLGAGADVRETIEVQDETSPEPWIIESTAPRG
ncbi:hypothetical protein BH11ACT2_BH11ACT2_01230 [soil metagenome]